MKDIILLGAGGHCKSVIDVIECASEFRIAGILDVPEKVGELCCGYEVVGTDKDIPVMVEKHKNFHISLGFVPYQNHRDGLYNKVKQAGGTFPVIKAPDAIVAHRSVIGEGSIIMHGAIVNTHAHVGVNCIINTKALVEHDAKVGDHVHIATAAVVNGGVKVENRAFIGSGSVINQNIAIGENAMIASGAVVVKDVKAGILVAGNPAIEKGEKK